MRIIHIYAPIVEMLFKVSFDLNAFIFFYIIIIFLFSMLISILGIGNHMQEGTEAPDYTNLDDIGDITDVEYRFLPLNIGHMIDIIKMSTGDFGIIGKSLNTKNIETNVLFWVTWFIIVFVATIIFLNFVIAEASASYEEISAHID